MPLVKILVSRFEDNFFLKNLILAPPKSRKNLCCANFLKFSQISICKPIELSITKKDTLHWPGYICIVYACIPRDTLVLKGLRVMAFCIMDGRELGDYLVT